MSDYHEGFVRLLYGIILAQFAAITILLGGFTSEYVSNVYFRMWVESSFPQLSLLLTGQFDALIMGMALGGTVLLIQWMKNESRIVQRTGLALAQASSSTEPSGVLLSHVAQTNESEMAIETPDQILGELEKQDF
ncbi:MAG TPA: hypothetical protein VNW25_03590 [Candidatus Sulfotelmatobacter sp.]|jgi:hypothetical protein|nr:hypothetical protein [Candidatus Sulfotelmatobacter sp.]